MLHILAHARVFIMYFISFYSQNLQTSFKIFIQILSLNNGKVSSLFKILIEVNLGTK
jgi:hypothetical protein